jgi:hypothetical protein
MGNFDSGVSSYIKAQATVEVYFPVDKKGTADISCSQCDYFRRQSQSCALNGKICAYPTKYVGAWCPLELVENVEKRMEE